MPIWYVDLPHEGEGPVHRLFFNTKKEGQRATGLPARLIKTGLNQLEQNMDLAWVAYGDYSQIAYLAQKEGVEEEYIEATRRDADKWSKIYYEAKALYDAVYDAVFPNWDEIEDDDY